MRMVCKRVANGTGECPHPDNCSCSRAYIQTNFDRRGNVRGYSVYNPQGRLIKRYEARAYLNKRLCFELATGLRDSLNALLEQTERQPEAPFVSPPNEGR